MNRCTEPSGLFLRLMRARFEGKEVMMSSKLMIALAVAIVLGATTRGSAGTCNWGGNYADNQCVWYSAEDEQGVSLARCKVCKDGQWLNYRCDRRCLK